MSDYKEIKICEVCSNTELKTALNLGKLPLCDDLIPISDNQENIKYPTEILFCNKCFTAHHKYQVNKNLLFPNSYHYRARFTSDVLNGMRELVNSLIDLIGPLDGKKILDIGCNDGSLLDIFKKEKCKTYGIEPTGAYIEANDNHIIINDYFNTKSANELLGKEKKIDIITFTNVFAHIDNLNELLNALKKLISNETILVIENHYLGSILSNNQFDTFYHEHPRSYSYQSFKTIARSLNLYIHKVEFPKRYGGNIRVFMGNSKFRKNSQSEEEIHLEEKNFHLYFVKLEENIKKWKAKKKNIIEKNFEKFGPMQAKAFPGRASILIKMLDLDEKKIEGVYEKPGSKKLNHYVPGTRIIIKNDKDLFKDKFNTSPILNLAWHIPNEIRNYLSENNCYRKVIDIIDQDDFK